MPGGFAEDNSLTLPPPDYVMMAKERTLYRLERKQRPSRNGNVFKKTEGLGSIHAVQK